MTDDSPAPPLSLGGNLGEFPLADVLTFLNMGLKTGAIEVISGSAANRIYIADGEVIHARTRNPKLQLPRFLVQRGLLTDPVARELDTRAEADRAAFRDVVVDAGLVDEEEMKAFEKILCSEITFEAMAWRDGKFAFLTGRKPEEAVTPLRINIQNLIMEGARRLDEAKRSEKERLERNMQIDRDSVVTLVCPAGRLEDQVVLNPAEWGIISLINGKRSLSEILSLAPTANESEGWLVLQRLQAARLIQIHPKVQTAPADESADVPEPPPAEAQQVQQRKTTMLIRALEPAGKAQPQVEAEPEPEHVDHADRPTVISMKRPDDIEGSDVKLITRDDVTTSHGMFGRRLPARLITAAESREPATAFELSRPIQTIGRADSNDIVLPHQSVSKQHAQVLQDGDGWRLIDLKSTNGTRVNGEKVVDCRLSPGDRVQIGAYAFHFDAVGLPLR